MTLTMKIALEQDLLLARNENPNRRFGCGGLDSNQRFPAYETGDLTTCPPRNIFYLTISITRYSPRGGCNIWVAALDWIRTNDHPIIGVCIQIWTEIYFNGLLVNPLLSKKP